MPRYRAILAYDGSGFTGSQRQPASRTVQGELEKALRKIGWSGKSVLLAGRTDSGVHATGQAVAFDLEWMQSLEKLLKGLNAILAADLVVKDLQPASAVFHPRFDAISRRYSYRLFCETIRDPFRERFAWRVWPAFDGNALQRNAEIFLGKHDFAAFGSRTTPQGTTARTVTIAEWRQLSGGEWQFEVQADAFLYRMVRRLVFVQVSVAQGKCSVEKVQHALSKQQGTLPSGLAPAHGLTLTEVLYATND